MKEVRIDIGARIDETSDVVMDIVGVIHDNGYRTIQEISGSGVVLRNKNDMEQSDDVKNEAIQNAVEGVLADHGVSGDVTVV